MMHFSFIGIHNYVQELASYIHSTSEGPHHRHTTQHTPVMHLKKRGFHSSPFACRCARASRCSCSTLSFSFWASSTFPSSNNLEGRHSRELTHQHPNHWGKAEVEMTHRAMHVYVRVVWRDSPYSLPHPYALILKVGRSEVIGCRTGGHPSIYAHHLP